MVFLVYYRMVFRPRSVDTVCKAYFSVSFKQDPESKCSCRKLCDRQCTFLRGMWSLLLTRYS